MATYKNLYIDQGSDFTFRVDLIKSLGDLDLTNYSSRGQIRRTYNSTSSTDFAIVIDVEKDELRVSLTALQTGALNAGRYVYDIEVISPDSPSITTRVIEGQVDITPRVTQPV